jgi:hypothetical protein
VNPSFQPRNEAELVLVFDFALSDESRPTQRFRLPEKYRKRE